ncbi:MAG: hypothetical protein JJE52_00120 [Acidimicrobiia bacterium]|nr:hypothetical protein [Acidimicrobiia bacterium]
MSTQVPLDLELKPLDHDARTLGDWLTTFQMAAVVLDPYTHESAWVLDAARRILTHFGGADCRVAFIVAGTESEAQQFLGPISDEILTLSDETRGLITGAGVEQLPAFLHIAQDGTVVGRAEGWAPQAWREVAIGLALHMSWTYPIIPAAGDPVAYPGSPASGAA